MERAREREANWLESKTEEMESERESESGRALSATEANLLQLHPTGFASLTSTFDFSCYEAALVCLSDFKGLRLTEG